MRKTDMSHLGDGGSILHFWMFNAGMAITWLCLYILEMFAVIGIGYMFTVEPMPDTASVTSQLGCAFINLMYGISVFVIAATIRSLWLFGNIYILRMELYGLLKRLFRWGDL